MTISAPTGNVLLVTAEPPVPDEMPAIRAAMLAAKCENCPVALRLRLSSDAAEPVRLSACELLQYADLCVIDRASSAVIGVENQTLHPDPAAALARKLIRRFGFGGVVLPEEGYARLDSEAARFVYPFCKL